MANRTNSQSRIKTGFLVVSLLIGAALAYYFFGNDRTSSPLSKEKRRVIAVSQLIEFPVLEQVRKGVEDGLQQKGYEIGKNIKWIYENAQGNIAITAQIAKKFVSLKPDVIVAITTPAAQAVAATKTSIPLVFVAVTYPWQAGLIRDPGEPLETITGASDKPPVVKNFEMIQKILPDMKTLGVLYNSAEPNSSTLVEILRKLALAAGLKLEVAVVSKTGEALSATRQLLDKVDAIILPLDNTVTAVANSIIKVCTSKQIPVFALDPALLKEGALASIGVSEYQVGVNAGHIVARILEGEHPGSIPISYPNKHDLYLNHEKAKELGIQFPQDLIDQEVSEGS